MFARLDGAFGTLADLQRAIESLRGSDWDPRGTGGGRVYPPVNVFARGEDFVAVTKVPGSRRDEITVQVRGRQLRIAGTRPPIYGDGVSVHRRERASGTFDRTVTLPIGIDPDGVKAELHDGVLAVLLPRAGHERARTISID